MRMIKLKTEYPLLAAEWDVVRNGPVPDKIEDAEWWMCDRSIDDRVWWKCSQNHKYCMTVRQRIDGEQCPHCYSKFNIVVAGENDLVTTHPLLIKYWNYDKNSMLPSQVSSSYRKHVWWKCDHDHIHADSVFNKAEYYKSGFLCPVCIHMSRDTISCEHRWALYRAEILKYWDPLRNFIDASCINPTDGQLFWWTCDGTRAFKASVSEWLLDPIPDICSICKLDCSEIHRKEIGNS